MPQDVNKAFKCIKLGNTQEKGAGNEPETFFWSWYFSKKNWVGQAMRNKMFYGDDLM